MDVLTHKIKIRTTPARIWNFFKEMDDKKYLLWHPQDHVSFKWVKGKPMEEGSVARFEEYLHGKLHKMSVKYLKAVPNKLIEFTMVNPPFWNIFYPKSSFEIKKEGNYCYFIAKNYFRIGIFKFFFSSLIDKQVDSIMKHMKEEGENLKKLMEK